MKWFNAERGYGFIALDGSKDVFVHASALQRAGIEVVERVPCFRFEAGEQVLKLGLPAGQCRLPMGPAPAELDELARGVVSRLGRTVPQSGTTRAVG